MGALLRAGLGLAPTAALTLLLTLGPVRPTAGSPARVPGGPAPEAGTDFHPLPAFGGRLALHLKSPRADASARLMAVEAGLSWLAAHQAPDGSWPPHALGWCRGTQGQAAPEGAGKPNYTVGVSGAALLAFLGAGVGPASDSPHAEAVRRGLAWLVSVQQPTGCLGAPETAHFLYNHAYALLALGEAYALTGLSSLRGPVRRALAFAHDARNPTAGWRYGIRPGDSDTSLTNTLAGALVLARRIGQGAVEQGALEPVEPEAEAVKGVHVWLGSMLDAERGRLGYVFAGSGSARVQEVVDDYDADRVAPLEAGALVVRRLLPWPTSALDAAFEAKAAARLAERRPEGWRKGGGTDCIHYLYGTWATSLLGGASESAWQDALLKALLPAQRSDGDVCDVKGSWDPLDAWALDGGRLYATAFNVLALLGHLRHAPISSEGLAAALASRSLPAAQEAWAWRMLRAAPADPGERALLEALAHPSREVRVAVAPAAAAAPPAPALDRALAALVADAEPAVRRAACRALAAHPAAAARLSEALTARLADADEGVIAEAAAALGSAGPAVERARERLGALVAHPSAPVAAGALVGLWPSTPERLPLAPRLRGLLEGGDPALHGVLLGLLAPGDLGPLALTPAVLGRLASPDPATVLAAARLLREDPRHAGAALAALSAPLAGDDPRLCVATLDLLERWPVVAGLPYEAAARHALDGPSGLRRRALAVLVRAPTGSPLLLAALYAAAGARSVEAEAALASLSTGPEERARLLADALARPERGAREGALAGLRRLGPAAVDPLRGLLRDGSPAGPEVRLGALEALASLGPLASGALPELRNLLEFPAPEAQRLAALRALGAPGIPGLPLLDQVVRLVAAGTAVEALEAAGTLVRLAGEGGAAAERLEGLLRALWPPPAPADPAAKPAPPAPTPPTPETPSKRALLRLAGVPAAARAVGPTLVGLLGHPEAAVASAAVEALSSLSGDVVPLLRPVLDPKREGAAGKDGRGWTPALALRRPALSVLERVGRPAVEALPWIVALLSGPLAEAAADALVPQGKPAVAALAKSLGSPDPALRRLSARALGRIGPEASGAVAALRRLLKDADSSVRLEAEEALRQIARK